MSTQEYLDYIEQNQDRFLNELLEFLSIPSVSTDPEMATDVKKCANWLIDHLNTLGLDKVELHPTPGHPIVYAEHCQAPGKPTILVYGHYDVQPPDPLELWETPPFEPTIRDGKIFARGATDDKGQVFAHIKGIEAHLKTFGKLPINVKLLIEGEEEVGSVNLDNWISDNTEKLACDAVIISDSQMYAPNLPSITYGLRGLAYMEVKVTGPGHDLHSGLFGGAIPNPINELSRMIGSLHDENGRITVPGFYDDVIALEDDERKAFAELPFSDKEFMDEAEALGINGEADYSVLERIWARPTLDCNGIWGGFTGPGAKTVLPSVAQAKISCRLVPGQCPEKIANLLKEHLQNIAPDYVKVEINFHHGGKPVLVARDTPTVQGVLRALRTSWNAEPVFTRGGGSIPVVATFSDILNVPTVLVGFGLGDDRLHSPNEKFNLENYYGGIKTSALIWDELATGE